MATDDLHERLDADLEELRPHFDLTDKTAKAWCDDWRAAGFLIRRPATRSRGETYELSSGALAAIRMLEQLAQPASTVTESRLVALAEALRRLAVDTDPDVSRRIEALQQERALLDERIQALRSGELDVLDDRAATERTDDVLLQAQSLPTDFARVRARFEELNRELRANILTTDATQTHVLDEVFEGVDLIASSDEGRTFGAFTALLRDPERSARIDADVTAILSRDFAIQLDSGTRRSLRTLMRELKAGSREVEQTLTEFARGLRRYVISQEFQRDRALRDQLRSVLALAQQASCHTKPYADMGFALELSSMQLTSVGEITPCDPSDFDAGGSLPDAESAHIDLEELAAIARESDIDFDELCAAVDETVSRSGPCTVGEVLSAHPATQGIASVVGLLSLASRYGAIDSDREESLVWHGTDGVVRSACVTVHRFVERIEL